MEFKEKDCNSTKGLRILLLIWVTRYVVQDMSAVLTPREPLGQRVMTLSISITFLPQMWVFEFTAGDNLSDLYMILILVKRIRSVLWNTSLSIPYLFLKGYFSYKIFLLGDYSVGLLNGICKLTSTISHLPSLIIKHYIVLSRNKKMSLIYKL